MTTTTLTFRDMIRKISPPWLQRGRAERFLYALGVQIDAFGDALTAGVKSRFPLYYSNDSLAMIGRERRISRGLSEPEATYGKRLQRWLDDHRGRGGPYALLAQLHAYFAPNNFAIDLIYRNGRRFRMSADGTITRDTVQNFTPDANPAQWARYWLFFYTDAYPAPISTSTRADLRLVPHEWNAAHCLGTIVIFPTGSEMWNFPLDHAWNEPGTWNTGGSVDTIPVDD